MLSLDSIVQRYRQEEIVEGHTLGSAVDQVSNKGICFLCVLQSICSYFCEALNNEFCKQ